MKLNKSSSYRTNQAFDLRPLIFKGLQPRHLSNKYSVRANFLMFSKLVLTNTDIFSGTLESEIFANRRPKLVFPSNEIVFNTKIFKKIKKKRIL